MNDKKLELLQKLYEAHRFAWSGAWKEGHRSAGYVEVGWINGVNPRTARALCEDGLAIEECPDMDMPPARNYVRLPLPLPFDSDEHRGYLGVFAQQAIDAKKGKKASG